MTTEPTTGPVPRLHADTSAHGRAVRTTASVPVVASPRDAVPTTVREAVPRSRRGLPITVGGVVAIVLLLVALVGVVVAGASGRATAASSALVVAGAFAVLVVVIIAGGMPRIVRDHALRRRFPDAVVVTAAHGTVVGTRSIVITADEVTVWASGRTVEPEHRWPREQITRAVSVPRPRSVQHSADLVLVVDGRDEVFRPFRSAVSFAERMDRDAVATLAETLGTH